MVGASRALLRGIGDTCWVPELQTAQRPRGGPCMAANPLHHVVGDGPHGVEQEGLPLGLHDEYLDMNLEQKRVE